MSPVWLHNNQVVLAPADGLKASERSFQGEVASGALEISVGSCSACTQSAFNVSVVPL